MKVQTLFAVGFAAVCMSLLHFSTAVSAQEHDVAHVVYEHEAKINGQTMTAKAKGIYDFTTGTLILRAEMSEYIVGYKFWTASIVCQATQSLTPIGAVQSEGAQNLRSLLSGPVSFKNVITTKDKYADFTTNVEVSQDKNGVIHANLKTKGKSRYPILISQCSKPIVYRQTPGKKAGTIIETAVVEHMCAGGEKFYSKKSATYTLPGDARLTRDQIRTVEIHVLHHSNGYRNMTLVYQTRIQRSK